MNNHKASKKQLQERSNTLKNLLEKKRLPYRLLESTANKQEWIKYVTELTDLAGEQEEDMISTPVFKSIKRLDYIMIVGLAKNNNGRKCFEHDCCGSQVAFETKLILKPMMVMIDDKEEESVAAYIDKPGGCIVGFIQKSVVASYGNIIIPIHSTINLPI